MRCQRCRARQPATAGICQVCGDLDDAQLEDHAQATLSRRSVFHLSGVVGVFATIALVVATLPTIAVSPVAAAVAFGCTLVVFSASVFSLEQGKLYRWLKKNRSGNDSPR